MTNGGVKCLGSNNIAEAGYWASNVAEDVPGLNSGATAIAAGFYHTCAIVSNGAKCWGTNVNGELGNGQGAYIPRPVNVFGTGLQLYLPVVMR
jgi:hypothetical protein